MELIVTSKSELRRLLQDTVDQVLARRHSAVEPSSDEPKEWLTNKEAQEFLGLSRATLQRYRQSGKLPYSKVGSNVYYRYQDIVGVLEDHQVD